MSRHVVRIDGEIKIQVVDTEKCKYMYDDTCCNDSSYYFTEFPSARECANCEYFAKEVKNGEQ